MNHSKLKGAWVAQLVKSKTLDFVSGHEIRACEIESRVGTTQNLHGILCLCPSPAHTLSLRCDQTV